MPDKGSDLNKRVWSLFEKAGFKTKPNSNNPNEEVIMLSENKERTVDLVAWDEALGIKIIGENTTEKRITLTSYFHDYLAIKKKADADSVLFVFTGKEITDADRAYAESLEIRAWGNEELNYYEALVDAIGNYAKYEIIHSFGLRTEEEKYEHCALAIRFHQPHSSSKTNLFLFTITPEKLLKTCVIYRKAQKSAGAYQRMVKKRRLNSIRKFVTQSDALLPPNIIVHLNEKTSWSSLALPTKDADNRPFILTREKDYELVVLRFPMEYASLELIDGQHRLYGFVEAEAATKENFNLAVLGLHGLPYSRKRDTFVSINDKAQRTDANLVTYLKYTDDEDECQKDPELMAIKIVVELNKIKPFKDKIKLLDIGEQKITLKGFSGYDLKSMLGRKGLLRKYYPSNSSKDFVTAVRLYFNIIENLFSAECSEPDLYIIFTNRGISAFLKLLKSILKTSQCPLSDDIARKYLQVLKSNWKDGWEISKLRNAYVGSKGWKDFHRDLVLAIQKTHNNFQE